MNSTIKTTFIRLRGRPSKQLSDIKVFVKKNKVIYKHIEYNLNQISTKSNNTLIHLGIVLRLSSSSLWLFLVIYDEVFSCGGPVNPEEL